MFFTAVYIKLYDMAYRKLFITLLISFIVMYSVMFLNVDEANHIYLSLTRTYMSLLMVMPMAVLMLLMMPGMYRERGKNATILATAIIVFAAALFCLRSQTPVNDIQYMKAMIPHHSSAVMTSRHASIKDPRVRQLADSIIASQRREIAEMKALIADLEK